MAKARTRQKPKSSSNGKPKGGRHRRTPEAGEELTDCEIDVWHLVACELDDNEVADKLGIQPGTVSLHMRKLMRKLNVYTRAGLAKLAVSEELVEPTVLRYGERASCAGAHKVTAVGAARKRPPPKRFYVNYKGNAWLKQ